MGFCATVSKYLMFFVNFVFAVAGLGLLGLGVAAFLQVRDIVEIPDQSFTIAPIGSMIVGSIVFLIAFFGCCGAIRENNCMLVTYSIFMLVLMILKVVLASLIFVRLDDLLLAVPNWLNQTFSNNQAAFHEIETTFQCCGTSGPASYLSPTLPPSCCAPQTTTCTLLNANSGCNGVVQGFFHDFGLAIGVVAIIVAAIELVAIVFGLCLANHARNKSRRTRY